MVAMYFSFIDFGSIRSKHLIDVWIFHQCSMLVSVGSLANHFKDWSPPMLFNYQKSEIRGVTLRINLASTFCAFIKGAFLSGGL
jgi:hypothetical protein